MRDQHGHAVRIVEQPNLVYVCERPVDGRARNRDPGVRDNARLASRRAGSPELTRGSPLPAVTIGIDIV